MAKGSPSRRTAPGSSSCCRPGTVMAAIDADGKDDKELEGDWMHVGELRSGATQAD